MKTCYTCYDLSKKEQEEIDKSHRIWELRYWTNPLLYFGFWFFIGLLIVLIFLAFVFNGYENKGCQAIGFKDHDCINGICGCQDYDGNIHFVEQTNSIWEDFPNVHADYKEVSIGGVWIASGGTD